MSGAPFELTPETGAAYVGKRILVGLTYYNRRGRVTNTRVFHGIVEAVSGPITVRMNSGATISVPPVVREADRAIYHLRKTGEVVEYPDLLSEWEVHAPNRTQRARELRYRSVALRAARRRA